MPIITVLPHDKLCPQGASFTLAEGDGLCSGLLAHQVNIEHACDQSLACTTCHVVVREGFASLESSEEKEDDLLDRAWGLSAQSRLSCQVRVASAALTIELPKYTINHARE
jgi:ferredoxin, 2Fe-2S